MDMFKILSNQTSNLFSGILPPNAQAQLGKALNTTSGKSNNNNSIDESNLLGNQLKSVISEGLVIFSTSGPFQDFLSRLEDAILLFLIEVSKDNTKIIKIIDHLDLEYKSLGPSEYNLKDSTPIYPRSNIGKVRMLIRRIARFQPNNIVTIIMKSISLISEANAIDNNILKSNRLLLLENHSKSLTSILTSNNDLTFFPFDDDPFCNVIHLTKYLWKHVKSLSNFGFRLLKCASQQLQEGIYAPVKESPDPSFINPQGYSIFRYKCRLSSYYAMCESLENESNNLSNIFNDPKLDIPSTDNEMIFIWYIVNVKLNSVYYYCPTCEPWGLPPAFGWLCANLGTNPPPEVQLCELNETSNNENLNSLGQSTRSFPLSNESFRNIKINRPSSATKNAKIGTKKIVPVWETGSNINILESAPVITLRLEDRNKNFVPVTESLTQNADIQTAIGQIRKRAEISLRTHSLQEEIIPKCEELSKYTSKQSNLIYNRKNWLNDATIDELIKGCPYKLIDSEIDNEIENEVNNRVDISIDNEFDKLMRDFEDRWKLETIISKLHVPPPPKAPIPLAIDFTALLATIFQPQSNESTDKSIENNLIDEHIPTPEEFFDICVPKMSLYNNFVQVQFLGIELWPPVKVAQAKGYLERLNYVIRISLSESKVSQSSDTQLCTSFESDNTTMTYATENTITATGKKVSPFAAMRSELLDRLSTRSLLSHRRVFTIHRDLTSICALHTELQRLFKDTDVQPPPFPDPYDIADNEEIITNRLRASEETINNETKKLRFGQPYNYSLSSGLLSKGDPMAIDGIDDLELGMYKLQQYLEDVFALVEEVEDVTSDESSESLSDQLGKLLATFLESSETEDLADFRRVFQLIPDRREMDDQGISILLRRPIWFNHSFNGLSLRLLYNPVTLHNKSEDELLRLQKNKCIGCGSPLYSAFFGLQKNYALCKFLGGLFCRRWCHGEDRRVLPYRMLTAWDSSLQRVCRIAAEYLDSLWSHPLTDIGRVNALLYEGVPSLRQIKLYRRSIAALIDRALNHPNHIIQAYDAVTLALSPNRMHLCACVSYYSMEDLVEVQTGVLLQRLIDLYTELRAIIPRKSKSNDISNISKA